MMEAQKEVISNMDGSMAGFTIVLNGWTDVSKNNIFISC
jgi:hypothetical protein